MVRILRINPHLRAEPVGDGMVILVGEHQRFLLKAPDDRLAQRRRGDLLDRPSDDLREGVLVRVGRATRSGLETLVLDHTRPDVGLQVVQVVVPGLRHIWPTLGPGRLYDVPARMGWSQRRLDESQMNPAPLFL